MTLQLELPHTPPTYPNAPAARPTDTSRAAANDVRSRANHLRDRVMLSLIIDGPQTPDECADRLRESVLAIRPRFSELRKMGKIADTGRRRHNLSGKKAIVWKAI